MLGGQQFRAYKTIMKTPSYLPRHSEDDNRLYRVIAWGAVIILAAFVAFIVSIGCLAFAWILPVWEQVQLAALIIYLVAVSREAWRQIRAGVGKENETENT